MTMHFAPHLMLCQWFFADYGAVRHAKWQRARICGKRAQIAGERL